MALATDIPKHTESVIDFLYDMTFLEFEKYLPMEQRVFARTALIIS